MSLRKKAVGGVRVLSKCEMCGKKVSILYQKNGKKICKKCLGKD